MLAGVDLATLRASRLRAMQLHYRWPADYPRPKEGDQVVIRVGEYKACVGVLGEDVAGRETVEVRMGCLCVRYYRNDVRPVDRYDELRVTNYKD